MAPPVTLGRDGIRLDGRLFYLLAGCVHYFRWPRAEWRPLLEQARWAGLNTIDTVIPWNRHEPRPGAFDFAEEADLGAFLDLCHELGLKAIVRPGPYICAEWENGGLPAWLTAEPGLALRTDDERYMAAIGRWFDALMPILVPRQYGAGGPVILCQIENEHWASGVYAHDSHQTSLDTAAAVRGMTVPQYTCMGAMPGRPELRNGWSGIAEKLVQTRALWPDNPMIVSELWSGWFDSWGASRQTRKAPAKLDVTLHQLAAVGAAGFSHWMWAGGTNFGFWGGRTVGGDGVHMTASYDYDAPVSELGEPREKALVARRHHLFLGSLGADLAPVLADAVPGGLTVIAPAAVRGRSEAGAAPFRTVRAGPGAPAAWRDFQATFLQNPGLEGATYQVFLKDPARHLTVEVEPASVRPIFAHMPLGDGASGGHAGPPLRLVCHTGRILGLWGDTLVIYGQPGEVGSLELALAEDQRPETKDQGGPSLAAVDPAALPPNLALEVGDTLAVRYWITEEPAALRARAGGRELTLLFLTQAQAELYEPGHVGAHPARAVGPRAGIPPLAVALRLPVERLPVAEASAADGWAPLDAPAAMERLGHDLGYGWYRAELVLDAPLTTRLAAPWLSDRARVLLDGADAGHLGVGPEGPRYTLPVDLPAGRHELRLLADNLGRFNYGIKLGELKGLLDTLYLDGEEEEISGGWSALWQEVQFAGEAVAHAKPGAFRPDAADVHLGHFAFEGPAVWLLRAIEARPGRRYLAHIAGDRNSGGFFVNGQAVERFSRHRSGGFLKADITELLRPGPNVLALFIQGYAGAPWRATLASYDPARPLPARWSFRPGVTPGDGPAPPQGPAFYRARFALADLPRGLERLTLRVGGLVKGQVWLNGRNVARFWQIGPQEDYKLPVSWLADQNELLIFAEEGHAEQVSLAV
ncbi:MAG TPA: beta-galactosidase [Chloroflexaceae bacterium]|nr:beta-galactosidase [Chloroflexaceae bacterium]